MNCEGGPGWALAVSITSPLLNICNSKMSLSLFEKKKKCPTVWGRQGLTVLQGPLRFCELLGSVSDPAF